VKLSISKVSVLVLSLALLAGGTVAEYSGFHRGSRGDFFDGHTLRFFADSSISPTHSKRRSSKSRQARNQQ